MADLSCKFARGQLWWRGTSAHWTVLTAAQLGRLRDMFAAQPEPYAQRFAREIGEALNQSQPMEKAA